MTCRFRIFSVSDNRQIRDIEKPRWLVDIDINIHEMANTTNTGDKYTGISVHQRGYTIC